MQEHGAAQLSGKAMISRDGPLVSYAANHRNPINALATFWNRHVNLKTETPLRIRRDMERYAASYAPVRNLVFRREDMPDLEDYLASKINWSKSKKTRYRQSWEFFRLASTPGVPGHFDYASQ